MFSTVAPAKVQTNAVVLNVNGRHIWALMSDKQLVHISALNAKTIQHWLAVEMLRKQCPEVDVAGAPARTYTSVSECIADAVAEGKQCRLEWF